MKTGKHLLCGLAAGALGIAMAHADDLAPTNQPAAAPKASEPGQVTATRQSGSPETITPNGIVSLFGQWQALFTVDHAAQAGQSAQQSSYILAEHESREGITVLAIDAKGRTVTFDNHGVTQKLSLANAALIGTDTVALDRAEPEYAPANLPKSYPPEFIRARTPDYLGGGMNSNTNFPLMTNQEQRILLIEAQREYLKGKHDPAAAELPATEMTPHE
jgi:hypothetical protein